jgi:hypothetical protein
MKEDIVQKRTELSNVPERPEDHPMLVFLDFTNPDEIKPKLLAAERNRVSFYIREFPVYKSKGYSPLLPDEIQVVIEDPIEANNRVIGSISRRIDSGYDSYAQLSKTYRKEWEELLENKLWEVARVIMGPLSYTARTLVPTAWGMGGSNWGKGTTAYDDDEDLKKLFGDGIVFIRMNLVKDTEDDSLKRKRFLIHEFIGHAVTVDLRADTPIDENVPKCSHQPDKEWLADEITAQIMYRMGYYQNLCDVPRQQMSRKAQNTTKQSFYSENEELKYPGGIDLVIKEIVEKLKSKEVKSDK